MRIAIVSKYPPIQGGVSVNTYWDAHILAAAGHEIHIVTNADEVEAEYRIAEEAYAEAAGPAETGAVTLHGTVSDPALLRLIPAANPFVSKLAGLAIDLHRRRPLDLLYGYYLEPYGVAASIAAAHTGTPFGLRHAGSDIGRLYRHPGLTATYQEIARSADFWLTGPLGRRGLRHLGVDDELIYTTGPHSVPTDHFHPDAMPLELTAVIKSLGATVGTGPGFDPTAPTIGCYGKLGLGKGTDQLLRAFAGARGRTGAGNLVLVSSGPQHALAALCRMAEDLDVAGSVAILPFMPPQLVPNFIAACTAMAYLEHDFPVAAHRPAVPRETFATGRCLILSADVAEYQHFRDRMRSGQNCLLVDPRDADALADVVHHVLADPAAAARIGLAGHQMTHDLEDWPRYRRHLAETFTQIGEDITRRRMQMTMAETQTALARLYVDEAFRGWFQHAPDDALAKYTLTKQERSILASIDRKMLAIFADSLRIKRGERIIAAFPLCALAFGKETVTRYFDRFYDLHPAMPGETTSTALIAFGRFLTECIQVDANLPGYAGDLTRYEAAINQLRHSTVDADDLLLLGATAEPLADGPLLPTARPRTADGVMVLAFGYDIPVIADALADGPVPEPAAKPTNVVLRPGASGAPTPFGITPAVAVLLSECTGDQTVEDIRATMAARFPAANLTPDAVDGALRNCHARGFIRFRLGTAI